jgi:hypothetical protein
VNIHGTSDDSDLARARTRAIVAAVEHLERELKPDVRAANAAAPPNTGQRSVEDRFAQDVGAFASPERIAVRVETAPSGSMLSARYRIHAEGWARALAFYESTRERFGMTFARSLPTRAEGLVVVAISTSAVTAARAAVAPGAVLVSFDDRAATSGFEILRSLPSARQNAVFAHGSTMVPVRLR